MSKLQIKLVRSPIACNKKMKETVKTLGLRKLGATVLQPDTPVTWGKIKKVPHLLSVEKVDGGK